MKTLLIYSFFFLIVFSSCNNKIELVEESSLDYEVKKIVDYDGIIWSIEFLDEDNIIFSDKKGKILIYNGLKLIEVEGTPEIYLNRQGGLMDIELHPKFSDNKIIFLSYAKKSDDDEGGNTAIARAILEGDRLIDLEDIFIARHNSEKGTHWGSRIEFDKNGYLYFTIGDRGSRDINPQDLYRDAGKVFRIYDDGSIPEDNPYVNKIGVNPAIYSYGHRNPQGIFLHPKTNQIWTNEHGPRGGDEINIVKKAKNYGWPVISYGINYDSTIFTEKTHAPEMEQPLYYWVPSIAPSCFEYLDSEIYDGWEGSLLTGSLSFGYLERLTLDFFGNVNYREKLASDIGRVRDVKVSPGGYIFMGVENEGIFKIIPKLDKTIL